MSRDVCSAIPAEAMIVRSSLSICAHLIGMRSKLRSGSKISPTKEGERCFSVRVRAEMLSTAKEVLKARRTVPRTRVVSATQAFSRIVIGSSVFDSDSGYAGAYWAMSFPASRRFFALGFVNTYYEICETRYSFVLLGHPGHHLTSFSSLRPKKLRWVFSCM